MIRFWADWSVFEYPVADGVSDRIYRMNSFSKEEENELSLIHVVDSIQRFPT